MDDTSGTLFVYKPAEVAVPCFTHVIIWTQTIGFLFKKRIVCTISLFTYSCKPNIIAKGF